MNKLVLAVLLVFFAGGNVLAQKIEKLDNGLTFIYKYIPKVQVVSVQAWVKTGSANETKRENGISHFLEHMVFKGTDKFAPGDIDKIVESSGGVLNAATSKEYTYYYVTIPSYKAEVAYDTISEMVFRAKFIPDEIEKEKPVVVQEIKRKFDRPTFEMWDAFAEEVFRDTPYAMEVIGSEDNVNAFSREMINDYYQRYYHPENMTLVVVGDIEYKDALKMAREFFSDKREVVAGEIYSEPSVLKLNENVERVIKKEIAQEYGILCFPAAGLMDSDNYALEVFAEILSGGEFSALNKHFKYDKRMVNSISGGYYGLRQRGTFLFTYNAQPGKSDEIKSEILSFTGEMKELLTDEAIEKAKNRLKSQSAFQREKSSSEANDIGFSYTVGLPEYYHSFLEHMTKVTKRDIEKAVEEIFKRHYIFIRTMPEDIKDVGKAG